MTQQQQQPRPILDVQRRQLWQVYSFLRMAETALIEIDANEDVTSVESEDIRMLLRGIQVSLDLRSQPLKGGSK